MMFSNFTEKARSAISNAHDAACDLGHYYVGSEHLLLGLIKEGTGVAAKALLDAGITEEVVIEKIKTMIGSNEPISKNVELSLTPRGKRILEYSAMEAQRLGHTYIGTEHILMAIIRDGDGVAAQIIGNTGVNLGEFYSNTVNSIDNEAFSKPQENKSKSTKTPTLDKFGRDLTALANENKFDPVIGRDKGIERVIQILSRRFVPEE
ncbi:MAG: hypothetical protein IKK18_06050 [Clostridia bacterium]|nr:hypothetical protein [Clostridia bacterium]